MRSKKKQRKRPVQPQPTGQVHPTNSDEDFRALYPRISRAQQARTCAALLVAELEAQLETIRASLEAARNDMVDADRECVEADTTMAALRPRLCFRGDLPDCVALSILGSQLSHRAGGLAAMVCREFRATVGKARELNLFKRLLLTLSAGCSHTVACTQSGVCSFGNGEDGRLGHEGDENEDVPRAVKALDGKGVVGVSAGAVHTVAWTEAGEVYTFGRGGYGQLGHGGEDGEDGEDVPRVVEALAGQRVVGASAGDSHTVVWTEAGEVYTFGNGECGQLGHGDDVGEYVPRMVEALVGQRVVGASAGEDHTVAWTEAGEVYTFGHGGNSVQYVPRVVEALAGQRVVGASAAEDHTVVWTEAGEVYTFGRGGYGQLGHGGEDGEYVPRMVEALAGQMVVGASAGGVHTVVWTEASEIYTFGNGGYGQLGQGWGASNNGWAHVPRILKFQNN